MQYVTEARSILDVVRKVMDDQAHAEWHVAFRAIVKLHPHSALSFSLHEPEVWPREARRRALGNTSPEVRYGFYFEDLVTAAEAAASADGSTAVHEVHLARACVETGAPGLALLGIDKDALVAATAEREH